MKTATYPGVRFVVALSALTMLVGCGGGDSKQAINATGSDPAVSASPFNGSYAIQVLSTSTYSRTGEVCGSGTATIAINGDTITGSGRANHGTGYTVRGLASASSNGLTATIRMGVSADGVPIEDYLIDLQGEAQLNPQPDGTTDITMGGTFRDTEACSGVWSLQ